METASLPRKPAFVTARALNRPMLIFLAMCLGIVVGACTLDGDSALRQELTCNDYCAQAKSCDDEVDEDKCVSDCLDTIDDCQADEQEAALDDLDMCAAESCDDFAGCTVGAGAQCFFGI